MQIGEQEAHFLALCKEVLDEEKKARSGIDFFDFEIPVKKLRRAGFREDELQRVAQSLELKGLVKPEFNHRDELKRLSLQPEALNVLREHLAANARIQAPAPAQSGSEDPGAVIRSLAHKIALAERAGREWSALNTLVETLLRGEKSAEKTVLLEHLDILVQQALATGAERRSSVVRTLMERVETMLPSAGEARTAWDALKHTIQGV